jgi:hypothetical protein
MYRTTGCDVELVTEPGLDVNTVPLISATVAPKQPALRSSGKERRESICFIGQSKNTQPARTEKWNAGWVLVLALGATL